MEEQLIKVYFSKSDIALVEGRYDWAILWADSVLEIKPNSVNTYSDAYLRRGLACMGKKDFFAALLNLEYAIRLNPKNIIALREASIACLDYAFSLHDLLIRSKFIDCAIAYMNAAILGDGFGSTSIRYLGFLFFKMENYQVAKYCFSLFLVKKQDRVIREKLAECCMKLKLYEEAIKHFAILLQETNDLATTAVLIKNISDCQLLLKDTMLQTPVAVNSKKNSFNGRHNFYNNYGVISILNTNTDSVEKKSGPQYHF